MMMSEDCRDILIIEDDGDIADLISIYLYNQNYVPRIAGTLQEASRQLAERSPDLIICDIMLPDGEGTDWVLGVQKQQRYPGHLPQQPQGERRHYPRP